MAKEERADLSFREDSGFWWFCRAGSRRGWLQADVAKEDGGLRAGGVGSRGFSGGICLRVLLHTHCGRGLPAGLPSHGWGVSGWEWGLNSSNRIRAEGEREEELSGPSLLGHRWDTVGLGQGAGGEACIWLTVSGG